MTSPLPYTSMFLHVFSFTALTRFFAHFCLFLRLIDIPVPHAAIQIILEVYLQVLEVSNFEYLATRLTC